MRWELVVIGKELGSSYTTINGFVTRAPRIYFSVDGWLTVRLLVMVDERPDVLHPLGENYRLWAVEVRGPAAENTAESVRENDSVVAFGNVSREIQDPLCDDSEVGPVMSALHLGVDLNRVAVKVRRKNQPEIYRGPVETATPKPHLVRNLVAVPSL